jgi:hypothetical protein
MEHETAVKLLNESPLGKSVKVDLYEIYLEDVETFSELTALDKLEQGIEDLSKERDND